MQDDPHKDDLINFAVAQYTLGWLRKPGGDEDEKMPAAQSPYKRDDKDKKPAAKVWSQPTQWFWYRSLDINNRAEEAQTVCKVIFNLIKQAVANQDYRLFLKDTMSNRHYDKLFRAMSDPRHGTNYWELIERATFQFEVKKDHRDHVISDTAKDVSKKLWFGDPQDESTHNPWTRYPDNDTANTEEHEENIDQNHHENHSHEDSLN
jgi:hypothetical protein